MKNLVYILIDAGVFSYFFASASWLLKISEGVFAEIHEHHSHLGSFAARLTSDNYNDSEKKVGQDEERWYRMVPIVS